MKIFYGKAVYGQKEIKASINVLKNSMTLIDGPAVKELEKKVSKLFGKKYGLMVNSGSSANLLSLASYNFKRGSEIITPALTWSTTVSPIYQVGCIPHFVDVEKYSFLSKIEQIKKAINKKTVAIMLPNLVGNVLNWKEVYKIAKKKKLIVIEDSADTIGYTYKNKTLGKFSDVTTSSFYASHVVTGAGFGGIICFNDKKIYEKAKLLRGWGRSSSVFNESEGIKKRFSLKVGGLPYDGKYIFSDLGFNFLPSEISGAFALEQIKKLKKNIKIRISNFKRYYYFFKKYPDFFCLPTQDENIVTGWLSYPILINNNSNINRSDLQIYLEKRGVQTRPIFTGNLLRHPMMKNKIYKKVTSSFYNSDFVMKNGILIGCHQGLSKKEVDYVTRQIINFLKSKRFL
jgi:CDP-4-dehydro-6-deoxyglucose reductase, E1